LVRYCRENSLKTLAVILIERVTAKGKKDIAVPKLDPNVEREWQRIQANRQVAG
jgi:hypothetical protein